MVLIDSYAIWNNKGGVGKSTITFHVASRYAEQHPTQRVLVIDMCPQGNSSMMLLGSGDQGENKLLEYCTVEPLPQTVVGYLSEVISGGFRAPLPQPEDFIIQVNKVNINMPDNLYLMCGDGNLEPMVPHINEAANAGSLTPSHNPWVWIHKILSHFIENLCRQDNQTDWVVFLDTNPSFSVYTELAISSASKLIVPVNADDSSRVATKAMFTLLHGSNPPHPIYGRSTFATRAKETDLEIPKVHIIIGNRLTQYEGSAQAFGALSDATADTMYKAFPKNPERFTSRKMPIKTMLEFREIYSVPLRDFNTAGVVSAHVGKPLTKMKEVNYRVYGREVKVYKQRIDDCSEALDQVLERLEQG